MRGCTVRALGVAAVLLISVVLLISQTQSDTSRQEDSEKSATSERPTTENGSFVHRFINAYRRDWSGANEAGPEPPRRIPSAPLSSPPFPSADWNYGGSSVIGATNSTSYPFMEALYSGPNGEAWKLSGVQAYGWINPGFNLSTSRHSNLPEGYDIFPNRVDLDQAVIYVERVPDTVQTDHVDVASDEYDDVDFHCRRQRQVRRNGSSR
jgi:hypothetical protein